MTSETTMMPHAGLARAISDALRTFRAPSAEEQAAINARYRQGAAIERMTTLLVEVRHDVAELRAELGALKAPQPPSAGRVPLRVAARMLGRSDEYVRQRAARGEVDAQRIAGRWYVRIGDLEIPNTNLGGEN